MVFRIPCNPNYSVTAKTKHVSLIGAFLFYNHYSKKMKLRIWVVTVGSVDVGTFCLTKWIHCMACPHEKKGIEN